MSTPTIERVVVLSTAHIPYRLLDDLHTAPHAVADKLEYGWLFWVPDDPDAEAEGDEPEDDEPEAVHEAARIVLGIQRWARQLHCRWVRFDVDGLTTDALPTFPHDVPEEPDPYDQLVCVSCGDSFTRCEGSDDDEVGPLCVSCELHGEAGPCPDDPDGLHHVGCGCEDSDVS